MITLYGYPNTRSTRAAWALEEADADYDYVKIDLLKGEGRSPQYLKINPSGKVPALRDGDLLLTESAAIVTYIGELYPETLLCPKPGTPERALYFQWCFFATTELEQPLWTIAKHTFALPESWRVPQVIETARKEFAMALLVLETGLADKPYILGENFTAADILLSLTLSWAKKAEVLLPSDGIAAYMERTLTRPALARARAREAGVTNA